LSPSIAPEHMNHINAMVEDFDGAIGHYRDVLGAQFLMDMPGPDWHGCLMTLGGVIFQFWVPHQLLLHSRYGAHYVGAEFVVPDVEEARVAVRARGMRIVRELGPAFHTYAGDSFGVSLECYDQNFHAVPPPVPYDEPIKPLAYWRDEHPLGTTGLKRCTVAVRDLDAALDYFAGFLNGSREYEAARPAVSAEAVGLLIGDIVVELITPTGAGVIQQHLDRYGDGIRSTVFSVRDLGQTETHLKSRDVQVQPGDAPGSLAIAAADNHGLMFEFSE
jgi:catechol 2,3-dioxygenase-like lactoylglutathione lyase family enzyme